MIRLISSHGTGKTSNGKDYRYRIFALSGIGQIETEYQVEIQVEGYDEVFSDIVTKSKSIDFAGEKWIF